MARLHEEFKQGREEFGHWEGDLMQFRIQRSNILTPCERKTRITFAAPLKTKTAIKTGETLQAVLGALPPEARKTIPLDNGAEFALHQNLIAALGIEAFFCDPHSPWQRGTI